jgi:hypothetical protein
VSVPPTTPPSSSSAATPCAFLDGIEKPEQRQELGWMLDNLGKYLASQAGH